MKKTIKITTLLLSISFIGFSQELPKVKSEYHIHIERTNNFMIPPTSFEPLNNFKGFQNPNDQTAMIMTMEILGLYSEVTKGFNSELMKQQGIEYKTKKEIKVAEFNGLLIEVDQSANGM